MKAGAAPAVVTDCPILMLDFWFWISDFWLVGNFGPFDQELLKRGRLCWIFIFGFLILDWLVNWDPNLGDGMSKLGTLWSGFADKNSVAGAAPLVAEFGFWISDFGSVGQLGSQLGMSKPLISICWHKLGRCCTTGVGLLNAALLFLGYYLRSKHGLHFNCQPTVNPQRKLQIRVPKS